jgi:ATP-dependent Clp protease ATP-binding subunit ClpB
MRLDKLSVTAQQAFQASMSVAADANNSSIEPIHLLKALLEAGENNISSILKRIGADPNVIKNNVDEEVNKLPKSSGNALPMAIPSQDLMKIIDNSVKIAEKLGDSYATTEHLLIALTEDKGSAGKVLNAEGVTKNRLRWHTMSLEAILE